jgi:negative regulator of sigma E activity
MMRKRWKEKEINQAFKKMITQPTETPAFDKTWFKIEKRLNKRKKHFLNFTWKPWAHPVGWVAVAACCSVSLTTVLYQQKQADNADLDSYMITISNPMANVNHEMDGIKVPILLTDEPHGETTNILLSDEDHSDILSDI